MGHSNAVAANERSGVMMYGESSSTWILYKYCYRARRGHGKAKIRARKDRREFMDIVSHFGEEQLLLGKL